MARDTGFPDEDARTDFERSRRRANIARLASWVRGQPGDVTEVLPYDEVVSALGFVSERPLGLQVVPVAQIVGSVDRTRDFDRYFRPRSPALRARWQRLAAAQRRGEAMPPVELKKVGDLYFVVDGHHRVSIAFARGFTTIDADVTEVVTRIGSGGIAVRSDLLLKDHRRLFLERVPLEGAARERIRFTNAWDYSVLAESVEAWGFRLIQDAGEYLSRAVVAGRWYEEEFAPVIEMARAAGIMQSSTDAEVYLFVACERYRLVRKHVWTPEIIHEVSAQNPPWQPGKFF
ncbi:chromosome partitioning protein ParB [Tsukamurella tyrosinosolvens]|uniref:chromosome partitioning protein ParB n=1 Tax=Tsukamurella tyrosinosolvens TaxID=57704 RepID=UPI00079C60A6|nr:chromosome partitioning protein ParB [Tsukamurella tyrosinosolvens]AUN39760.1 chromosome partitioning protein ParB [Tsukamurella tyrosinosolvens]KXP08993.1 chromosome partitioning protein ParB [Tsukamurella tyrosinosolvens]KZL97221.1 chromosome partitioning protein ParB [Tsukamurella tyrosinosolvens]MCA4996878.1 chromosome partitioning protein ParB [Tsukamurella tyrosinosolvens]QRY86524.1 chromosome partitioning protein ParB [Tsukamurella tyrosinosolvens]